MIIIISRTSNFFFEYISLSWSSTWTPWVQSHLYVTSPNWPPGMLRPPAPRHLFKRPIFPMLTPFPPSLCGRTSTRRWLFGKACLKIKWSSAAMLWPFLFPIMEAIACTPSVAIHCPSKQPCYFDVTFSSRLCFLPMFSFTCPLPHVLSFSFRTGDIAMLQVEAVVNPTNESLSDKNPVSLRLYEVAGPELREECKTQVGSELITYSASLWP